MWKKLLCATVVALVATLLVLPAQAGEVLSPCNDCDKSVSAAPTLPQGETEEIQPFQDHTWGGDPDDPDDPYGSVWDLIMCLAYWSPDCDVYHYQTIWMD